jgi:hypothetical protein
MARPAPRWPFAAEFPASNNWSVTLASALTTTTGREPSLLRTMPMSRRIAPASSTDVPPNFITTKSSLCSNLLCRCRSPKCPLIPSTFFLCFSRKEKPTARSLLAVGSGDFLRLALLHPIPSSRRHVIRVDIAVPVDVIRVDFWRSVIIKEGQNSENKCTTTIFFRLVWRKLKISIGTIEIPALILY